MKFEFSPALQLAFDRARHFAARASAAEVEPRHLLGGLLAEEEGKGVALVIQAGADLPRLLAHLGLPATFTGSAPELPLAGGVESSSALVTWPAPPSCPSAGRSGREAARSRPDR